MVTSSFPPFPFSTATGRPPSQTAHLWDTVQCELGSCCKNAGAGVHHIQVTLKKRSAIFRPTWSQGVTGFRTGKSQLFFVFLNQQVKPMLLTCGWVCWPAARWYFCATSFFTTSKVESNPSTWNLCQAPIHLGANGEIGFGVKGSEVIVKKQANQPLWIQRFKAINFWSKKHRLELQTNLDDIFLYGKKSAGQRNSIQIVPFCLTFFCPTRSAGMFFNSWMPRKQNHSGVDKIQAISKVMTAIIRYCQSIQLSTGRMTSKTISPKTGRFSFRTPLDSKRSDVKCDFFWVKPLPSYSPMFGELGSCFKIVEFLCVFSAKRN